VLGGVTVANLLFLGF